MTRRRARVLACHARRCAERYEAAPSPPGLVRLVALCRAALDETPRSDPDRALRLVALGGALRRRFQAEGRRSDLTEALDLMRHVATLPGAHVGATENGLAVALSDRYESDGDPAALDEAIAAARRAVAAGGSDDHDLATARTTLATLLSDRSGDLGDLDGAAVMARSALDSGVLDDTGAARLQGLLSVLALDRYERFDDPADLDAARLAADAAVAMTPSSPDLPGHLNNLGNVLRLSFERSLLAADEDGADTTDLDISDLARAATVHPRAVAPTAPGAPDHPKLATNLGNVPFDLGPVLGDDARIDEAIAVLEDAAVATDDGSPHRAGRWNNLALALEVRSDRHDDQQDRSRAVAAYRSVLAVGADSDLAGVVGAASNWARWAVGRHARHEVSEACVAGLAAARTLHRAQVVRDHQLAWRRLAEGHSVAGAVAHARLGRGVDAVTVLDGGRAVLLDGGRAVLLDDALQRDRLDLARRARAEPQLVEDCPVAADRLAVAQEGAR